jgi:molybdopterin converting factor small subunit/tRNA threonylcarbamoyladenosine modification (KEOPS) complex Cgi121 subunit
MKVKIEVYGFLRNLLGSNSVEVEVREGSSLREVLTKALASFPVLKDAIEENGEVRSYFILFVNGVDYQLVGGYSYIVKSGDSIQVLPISHGGLVNTLERYLEEINSVRIFSCLVSRDLAERILSYVDFVSDECVAQVLPKKHYYGSQYAALVAYLTLRAMKLGINVSKKKSLEYLLYYFGDRQISNVLRMLKEEKTEEYVAIYACTGTAAGSPKNVFSEIVASCSNKPEDMKRPPDDALRKLVLGVLTLLS